MRQSRHDAIAPWAMAGACLATAGALAVARSARRQRIESASASERSSSGASAVSDRAGAGILSDPSNVQRMLVASAGIGAGMLIATYALRGRRYSGIKFKKSIIINRSAGELYAFWRDFGNLAGLSDILKSVRMIDDIHSRWTICAPGNIPIHWDAEITKDLPDEMIGWRSVEGAPIETAGYVRFEPAPGNRGTMVRVAIEYNPLASRIGAGLAALFGKRPDAHIDTFLRRLKQLTEAGEAAVSGREQPRRAS